MLLSDITNLLLVSSGLVVSLKLSLFGVGGSLDWILCRQCHRWNLSIQFS